MSLSEPKTHPVPQSDLTWFHRVRKSKGVSQHQIPQRPKSIRDIFVMTRATAKPMCWQPSIWIGGWSFWRGSSQGFIPVTDATTPCCQTFNIPTNLSKFLNEKFTFCNSNSVFNLKLFIGKLQSIEIVRTH